jgi:hypothetical protein
MRTLVFSALLAGLIAGCQQQQAASPSPFPSEDEVLIPLRSATKDYARFLEGRVASDVKLRERGARSDYQVDEYRVRLAVIQYSLAKEERKPEMRQEQARLALEARERQLKQMERLFATRGATEDEVDAAQRRLAAARYYVALEEEDRLEMVRQLRLAINLGEKELARAEKSRGRDEGSESDLDNGRFRLAIARFGLAKLEGSSEDRLKQVKLMVTLRERELKRVQELYGSKSYSQEVVDYAERWLLQAKLLEAVEEQQIRAARDALERLVLLTEKRLQYVIRNPSPRIEEQDESSDLAWYLAFRRYQLAEVAGGHWFEFHDDPLVELFVPRVERVP